MFSDPEYELLTEYSQYIITIALFFGIALGSQVLSLLALVDTIRNFI